MARTPRFRLTVLAAVTLAIALAAVAPDAHALVLGVNDQDEYTEYIGVTGLLTRQAPFRMVVPDDWNGTLIVYARGTGSAILLQEIGGQVVPIFDPGTGVPLVGTNPLANVPGYPTADNSFTLALEGALLDAGYAMVASDYKPDPRFIEDQLLAWAVEDGIRDTIDVTRQAKFILWQHDGHLENTILWGRSQGSIIALRLLETRPWLYDSVMVGCTVGAGAPRAWDTGMGVAIAFDVAFGEGSWASLGAGSPEGGDIPEDVSFATEVVPNLLPFLPAGETDPKLGLWEFIRLVNGLPAEGFYPAPGFEEFNWIFADVLFLTEVRGDLESHAKAGGRVAQNRDHVYRLSDADRGYLLTIGFSDGELDGLLAAMNARTDVRADWRARRYAKRYADVKGIFWGRPVLSAHTISDGLVPPEHESALFDSAARWGNDDLLVQVFTDAVGHCAFTPDQWFSVVAAMDFWLDTGVAPDSSFFPEGQDFNNDYEPGPWFQPPQH